jgi:hypothetical protein
MGVLPPLTPQVAITHKMLYNKNTPLRDEGKKEGMTKWHI